MNDGRKRRQAKQARRDARRRAMRPVAEPNQIDHVRNSSNAEHPLNMPLVVGKLIEVLLPHEFSYRARLSGERVDPTLLIDEAAVVRAPHYAEVVALLDDMAVGDEYFRQWCREEVAAGHRSHP